MALDQGHEITQVFFYSDGVTQANDFSHVLADEFDAVVGWQSLAKQAQIDLVVCVSATERRGIIDQDQAQQLEKTRGNLNSSFRVAGLGELHAASLESDRMVSFK